MRARRWSARARAWRQVIAEDGIDEDVNVVDAKVGGGASRHDPSAFAPSAFG
jgi:hypothetical protein